jgi:predicted small lipoprotein YifL
MTRARRAAALALALCALVGACGQKGALYLPDEQEAVEQRETSDTPQREDAGR